MRRFIADASHELRTPLTAIRGFAEYYRQRGGLVRQWDRRAAAGSAPEAAATGGLTPDDLDRIMQRVEKEAARMGLLVEDLLLLARLDQQRPLARNPIDLLSLAADAVHDARMLAPDRTISLTVQPGTSTSQALSGPGSLASLIGVQLVAVPVSAAGTDTTASPASPRPLITVTDPGTATATVSQPGTSTASPALSGSLGL
jgi:two-component system OmpR family sensor kinase